MVKKEGKKSIRRKFVISGLVFIFFVLLITSFFGQKGLLKIRQEQRKPIALLEEIEKLKKEKSRLEREIEEFESNPKAIEMKAREELWLMREDEKVIVKKKK